MKLMNDFYCDEVLSGRTAVKRVIATAHVLAFHHTRPFYPVHVVVIPKRHVSSLLTLDEEDNDLPVAGDWRTTDYTDMAAQLADPHARSDDLAAYDWLRQPALTTSAEEIASALSAWQALRDQSRLQSALTAPAYESVCHKVMEIAAVDAIIRSWPVALCHRDCHRDNFLRDDQGNLVWADWQEVGVGAGPEDLSFFWQRAVAVDDNLPVEQMLIIYHERLQAQRH